MTTTLKGPRKVELVRDANGHRDYKVTYFVESDSYLDGPATALATPGLPLAGATYLVNNDIDTYAYARLDASVKAVIDDDKPRHFLVEVLFSTKGTVGKCQDGQFENPLLEPAKVSGTFRTIREEATHDRLGRPVTNSSHEQIRGPQNEWDIGLPTVRIEQNVGLLNQGTLANMVNTVNGTPLWGLPKRCVKLSNAAWEKKFYGFCLAYYTRVLDFEINAGTWDRNIRDFGTKVLYGHWSNDQWVLDPIDADNAVGNRYNPNHFMRAVDKNGNPTSLVLDGKGRPWNPLATDTSKHWGVHLPDGTFSHCITGTCAAAKAAVLGMTNHLISGPFDTADQCSEYSFETGYHPDYLFCPGASPQAGVRHVEKYGESNFITLGIPLTL